MTNEERAKAIMELGMVNQDYGVVEFAYNALLKAITQALDEARDEAVREFVEWWEQQEWGTSIHPNNVEEYLAKKGVKNE